MRIHLLSPNRYSTSRRLTYITVSQIRLVLCMVMGVSHPWYYMCKGAMVLLRERFGNHYDPKVQVTFSNLFGNTFEDLDDFKMYLHFVLVLGNPLLDPKL